MLLKHQSCNFKPDCIWSLPKCVSSSYKVIKLTNSDREYQEPDLRTSVDLTRSDQSDTRGTCSPSVPLTGIFQPGVIPVTDW